MPDKKNEKNRGEKTAIGILGALVVGAAVGSITTYAVYNRVKNTKKFRKKKDEKQSKEKSK